MRKSIYCILLLVIVLLAVFFVSIPIFSANNPDADYEYYIDCDDQAVLTRYIGSESSIIVPSSIDGHHIKSTEGTFSDNNTIEKVVFSEGITIIGSNTFLNCVNLRDVCLPDSIEELGERAFSNTSLRKIILSKKTWHIGTGCFYNCVDLKFVKAEAEQLSIENLAFYNSGIELMQLSDEPRYWDNSFSSECKFSYNSITTFAMQHEPLYAILYFLANQPIVIRALFLFLLVAIVITFIYLLYRVYRRIRIILGKDKLTLYNSYNKKCINSVSLSDNSVVIIYKKATFFADGIKAIFTLIVLPLLFVWAFCVIAFAILDLIADFLKVFSALWIMTRVIILILLLVFYVVLIYFLTKGVLAICSTIADKHPVQASYLSARIRKIRKGKKIDQ